MVLKRWEARSASLPSRWHRRGRPQRGRLGGWQLMVSKYSQNQDAP
jgi:hypothetical protein